MQKSWATIFFSVCFQGGRATSPGFIQAQTGIRGRSSVVTRHNRQISKKQFWIVSLGTLSLSACHKNSFPSFHLFKLWKMPTSLTGRKWYLCTNKVIRKKTITWKFGVTRWCTVCPKKKLRKVKNKRSGRPKKTTTNRTHRTWEMHLSSQLIPLLFTETVSSWVFCSGESKF